MIMEAVKKKCKIVWSRCKRSSNGLLKKKQEIAPQGCFCVYVGPERQRFVLKIEIVNQPMFKMLLDDAESEYGFSKDGPIWLPCNVDLFCEALAEMEDAFIGCRFHRAPNSSSVFHSSWSFPSTQSSCHDYQLLSSSTSST